MGMSERALTVNTYVLGSGSYSYVRSSLPRIHMYYSVLSSSIPTSTSTIKPMIDNPIIRMQGAQPLVNRIAYSRTHHH